MRASAAKGSGAPSGWQLHTPVAPQGPVAFYPQCRQYPVDLVQERTAGAKQIQSVRDAPGAPPHQLRWE
jgi:hypothetical protein